MYEFIDLIFDLSPFIVTFMLFSILFIREWGIVKMKRDRLRLERTLTERETREFVS